MSSADNISKPFRPRSGLFGTLIVFLDFFANFNFEKKSAVNNKIIQIYPACKEIILQKLFVLISTYTLVCYDHSDSAEAYLRDRCLGHEICILVYQVRKTTETLSHELTEATPDMRWHINNARCPSVIIMMPHCDTLIVHL